MSNAAPDGTPERAGGARRAARSSRRPAGGRSRGGARALRTRRRADGLPGTVGMTVLGAFVPGSGYLYAGRRWLGAVVLAGWLAGVAALAWYFGRDLSTSFDVVFNPTMARVLGVAILVLLVVWAFVVLTSHRLVRSRTRPRWHTVVGYAAVVVVTVAGAAPAIRAAQYAFVTADAIEQVFKDDVKSATTPDASEDDPWAGQDRVNVLLLGGDGGEGRAGVRTDTVILASIDTDNGKTTMFSLPRNLMYAQFPEDSPLHDVYPDGYQTGQGDPGFDMLNAIYSQVPELHPGILGESDNEGADAVKLAVQGSLGLPVDYYLLVNLEGFKDVVDAMGGITVNVNKRVAINGNTDLGIEPTGWIDPGPDQHLDGFHALWFARGRFESDDYERMDRQRCAIDALIDAADPATLLTRYIDIVKAGQEILYTDIPRKLGPAFVDLLLRVKDGKVRSVVFRPSDKFFSGDPDYDYMRQVVQNAVDPPKRKKAASGSEPPEGSEESEEETPEKPGDVCAYNPEDAELSASD